MRKIILVLLLVSFMVLNTLNIFIVNSEDSHYIEITIHLDDDIYDTIAIDLSQPSFTYINNGNGSFTLINYPKSGESIVIGKANLPKIYPMIEVPSLEVSSITVSGEKWEEIALIDKGLPKTVYPVQPSRVKSDDNLSQNFVINYSYYSQNFFAPLSTVRILEKGTFRGVKCLLLELSPVKYNPIEGEVKILDSCRIDVYLSTEDDGISNRIFRSKTFDGILSSIIYNYSSRNYPGDAENYLIITYDDFYREILPFAEWKQKQGYTVTVVNTSIINENLTARELRDFIKTVYNSWNKPPVYITISW